MRGRWLTLGWLGTGLLIAAGCKTPQPNLKPPPHPEELTVPPQDDPRFSKPPAYPEDTLNQFPNKKKQPGSQGGPPRAGFGNSGMGGGMGGMGP